MLLKSHEELQLVAENFFSYLQRRHQEAHSTSVSLEQPNLVCLPSSPAERVTAWLSEKGCTATCTFYDTASKKVSSKTNSSCQITAHQIVTSFYWRMFNSMPCSFVEHSNWRLRHAWVFTLVVNTGTTYSASVALYRTILLSHSVPCIFFKGFSGVCPGIRNRSRINNTKLHGRTKRAL